jgi:hypothetical protein
LAPVFERIGEHLDAALAQPGLDHFFTGRKRRIAIAISDVKWRGTVVLTGYDEDDVRRISLSANGALKASAADFEVGCVVMPTDFIGLVWAAWSRRTRKDIRAGTIALPNAPDAIVGALFLSSADLRNRLDEIAIGGATPVLAIALDTTGTTRRRLKCRLRAIAFPLPEWAPVSGPVAGNA